MCLDCQTKQLVISCRLWSTRLLFMSRLEIRRRGVTMGFLMAKQMSRCLVRKTWGGKQGHVLLSITQTMTLFCTVALLSRQPVLKVVIIHYPQQQQQQQYGIEWKRRSCRMSAWPTKLIFLISASRCGTWTIKTHIHVRSIGVFFVDLGNL